MSYRLETPRPRRIPSPLNFDVSSKAPSILSSTQDNVLLYDLPATTSISPPITPRSPRRVTSPISPSFSGRSRGARNGHPTPPPHARNRSQTPQGVAQSELEQFAECCRAWYYQQDDKAGRLMTQTLTTLPASQRAPFSRLQASIRSAYHRSVNARKTAEFRAHLSVTTPGGSLLAHARADPRGKVAQKERYERMNRFIRTWCNAGMPGTKPYFEALWAIMRLQVIPENLGGAGSNRIEWELDDAMFKESAGKDFMLEAIDILKGVLGFEEIPSKVPDPIFRKDTNSPPPLPPRARRPQSPVSKAEVITIVHAKRPRAPSDPFLDAPPVGSSSHSPNADSILARTGRDTEESFSHGVTSREAPALSLVDETVLDDEDDESLRVWTTPDLTNPELLALAELFPSFITRRPLPRFPVPNTRDLDIEEGEEDRLDGRVIRFGTGTMWISPKQRSDGWEGGWWARFVMWWRRTFC